MGGVAGLGSQDLGSIETEVNLLPQDMGPFVDAWLDGIKQVQTGYG